jgi:hypothetical protein
MSSLIRIPVRFDPRRIGPEEFPALVERVPWMAALGKPHRCDAQVLRVHRWEEVPFPDSSGSLSLCLEHSTWLNPFYEDQRLSARLRAYGRRLSDRVYNLCCSRIPYNETGEPDHDPNRAAGFAGWVASSIGLSLRTGAAIPYNALRQWQWYVRGHWPCAYEPGIESPEYDKPGISRTEGRLVVF